MPVHWFYNPGDIIRLFGPKGIDGLYDAPATHPSSIMSLHSTSRGGRGQQAGISIIGDVILKGRKQIWAKPDAHYHHAMKAGDNTLNAWCAREIVLFLNAEELYDKDRWAQRYVDFMTADPPEYPDTYAESYHRGFFSNWVQGKALAQCGEVTHDTPSMGALVTVAPLALSLFPNHDVQTASKICQEHVWLTHPDHTLLQVVEAYVQLLHSLLALEQSCSPETLLCQAADVVKGTHLSELLTSSRGDAYVVGRLYSLACYITDSWPSVCYLSAKYYDDPTRALLANTNLGGENAHRGAVLGTLLGLISAETNQQWLDQLSLNPDLDASLEVYLDKFYPLH